MRYIDSGFGIFRVFMNWVRGWYNRFLSRFIRSKISKSAIDDKAAAPAAEPEVLTIEIGHFDLCLHGSPQRLNNPKNHNENLPSLLTSKNSSGGLSAIPFS